MNPVCCMGGFVLICIHFSYFIYWSLISVSITVHICLHFNLHTFQDILQFPTFWPRSRRHFLSEVQHMHSNGTNLLRFSRTIIYRHRSIKISNMQYMYHTHIYIYIHTIYSIDIYLFECIYFQYIQQDI